MFTAAQLCPVPSADTTEVAGVALPPGQQVIAREADKPTPVAWISDDILDADTTSCGLIRIPEWTAAGSPKVRRCGRDVHSPNADRTSST